ncbi:head maturation protease, ClpP-related [Microbacterium sp. cx-59]|uniref:head maturation protease, ClpP-related n=1 Tax=Microbacterium sp. cx-59 TaxID=2891207 RepID=UPI001E4B3AD0|nr:head maturation protease, ClpP-related [Microbacterium sp. cx-59]MCC4906964.1 ATP-dependent Clp protease proteolytic subunit [Microbacterium sp. cx-59]
MTKRDSRYWGKLPVPESKAEFFNAVTTPAPAGDGTVATIRLYGPIDSWGGYWGVSAKDVSAVLDALPSSVNQIVLRINSPGGEVFEGVSILNMLRAHKATVTAVVDGRAASAASVIAAGCDEVVMSPGTQMMIHSPSVIAWGNATHLRKQATILDGIEKSIVEIYTAKAGEKDWATLLADETWLTAAEAVEEGLADRMGVVPDAGEPTTVGDDDEALLIPDEDEPEDSAARLVVIAAEARASASQLPVSTEPGEPHRKEHVMAYDDLKAGLAKRLGVTDAAASDDVLLSALDGKLDEQPAPAATDAAPPIPKGAVVMDGTALEELRAQAALGVQARNEQISDRRDGIVAKALGEGRITAESRDSWREQLDKDEEGITALLNKFPKNTALPVAELGHSDDVTDAESSLYNRVYPTQKVEA